MGATIGSSEIYLTPGKKSPPVDMLPRIEIPTAAAVSLIIQILSNYVFVSRKPLAFEFEGGGTHVAHSPNFDILLQVNKPLFELFGLRMHIQLLRPGFYPSGGAKGRVMLEPITFSKVIDVGPLFSGQVPRSSSIISDIKITLKSIIENLDKLIEFGLLDVSQGEDKHGRDITLYSLSKAYNPNEKIKLPLFKEL